MKIFENRIPPPIVLLIALILIRIMAIYDSTLSLPSTIRLISAVVFVVIGLWLSAAGVLSFKKAETTINPLDPGSASHLVTSGIYRHTRNPMYLGMLAVTMAAAIYFSSVWSLAVVAGFYLFITRFQIVPEERAMAELFGDEFRQFEQRVRRWV